MSLEDLKAQRDLHYTKIIKLTDKMKKAVLEKSERTLKRSIPELDLLVDRFEQIHSSLLVKAKTDMSDPLYKEMFNAVAEVAGDTRDAAQDCLDSLEDSAKELERIQKQNKETQQNKKKYELINREFLEEWENMKTMISRIVESGTADLSTVQMFLDCL